MRELLVIVGRMSGEQLSVLCEIARRMERGLNVEPYRRPRGRGFEVGDLEGQAQVAVAHAVDAVLQRLGKRKPARGMPMVER